MGIPDLPAQLKIMQWHKLWRVCLLVVLFEELGGCALLPIGRWDRRPSKKKAKVLKAISNRNAPHKLLLPHPNQ